MATLATRELEIVEQVRDGLGLQLKQIATIVGADESTLHRWLSGTSSPRPIYISRLTALREFYGELRDAFSSLDVARRWLWEKHPAPFGGRTPVELLFDGRLERVTALLWNMNNGVLS
jgi:transcriptional regulator with XRE-family HTH domain